MRLSALQTALPLKLVAASGSLLLLPLLWWSDAAAGMAWAWSPLNNSPRLVGLLVALPLLALMLWQWQQIVQALWMLTRSAAQVEQTLPLTQSQAAEQRLNLGLPLLVLPPLDLPEPPPAPVVQPEPEPEPEAVEPVDADSAVVVVDAAVAVEPEQAPEQHEGPDLDAEVAEGDDLAGGSPEGHGGEADGAGGGEGEP